MKHFYGMLLCDNFLWLLCMSDEYSLLLLVCLAVLVQIVEPLMFHG